MRIKPFLTLLSAAGALALAAAPAIAQQTRTAPAQPAANPAPVSELVKQVDIPYERFTLANGLRVIVIENHAVPIVSVELNVKNGAYTQTPQHEGLAHLYEHMFFKANKTIPSQEKYLARLRQLGGQWNGTTSEERVNYYVTVGSDSVVPTIGAIPGFTAAAPKTPIASSVAPPNTTLPSGAVTGGPRKSTPPPPPVRKAISTPPPPMAADGPKRPDRRGEPPLYVPWR